MSATTIRAACGCRSMTCPTGSKNMAAIMSLLDRIALADATDLRPAVVPRVRQEEGPSLQVVRRAIRQPVLGAGRDGPERSSRPRRGGDPAEIEPRHGSAAPWSKGPSRSRCGRCWTSGKARRGPRHDRLTSPHRHAPGWAGSLSPSLPEGFLAERTWLSAANPADRRDLVNTLLAEIRERLEAIDP